MEFTLIKVKIITGGDCIFASLRSSPLNETALTAGRTDHRKNWIGNLGSENKTTAARRRDRTDT